MVTEPCSLLSAEIGEPLAGTAPHALTWVAVEHPGPWGRDAIAESVLPDATRALLLAFKAAGVQVVLMRRPGRREAAHGTVVLVARTAPGGAYTRRAVVPDLADLGDLARVDPADLAAGRLPALEQGTREPVLLVCTHGRRDACCARLGRGLLDTLAALATPEQSARIWECSHLGGHRFAPVTLSLPSGMVHGRVTVDEAAALLDSDRVIVDRLRGRTALPAPMQAAEIAVRQALVEDRADVLDVLAVVNGRAVPVDAGWAVPTVESELEVRHADGRAWRVPVRPVTGQQRRPESCGAEPTPVHRWETGTPAAAAHWH